MSYTSKYKEILVDNENNSPISTIAHLTIEEVYDLKHHTHHISDLEGIDSESLTISPLTPEQEEAIKPYSHILIKQQCRIKWVNSSFFSFQYSL